MRVDEKCPYQIITKFYEYSFARLHVIFDLAKCIFENIAAAILKICIFQEATFQSRFSKIVFMPIARNILNIWQRCQGIPQLRTAFDSGRLERSRLFLNQFGEEKTVETEDGHSINYMLFRPENFRKWIEETRGEFRKEGNNTIIQAKDAVSWEKLQRLREFRCFEINEKEKSIPIPSKLDNANQKCILHCQGFGKKIPMDKKYIGLHLALGFNYVVFDWRNQVSLKGYFKDAEAVFSCIRNQFDPANIIAMGLCRSTFVVSHLKSKFHKDGVEAVLIHPIPSLSATVNKRTGIAKKIGLIGLRKLLKTGEDFDNLKRLGSITKKGLARTFVITSEGDKTLPANLGELFKDAIKDKGPCIIWNIPKQIGFDPHFRDPLLERENFLRYGKLLVQ